MTDHKLNIVCRSISESDLGHMADFTVRKEGGFLADYLAYRTTDGKIYSPALNDELASRARTYLVENDDTNEIIAYFTLKAGMVGIKQSRFPYTHQVDAVPGIELANFAVNTVFLQAHQNLHGVGYMIFYDYILPKVEEVRNMVGVKILYIYALPHKALIEHYHTYGFAQLLSYQQKHIERWFQPRYDKGCVFMYQIL